jgi:hypothetical protein
MKPQKPIHRTKLYAICLFFSFMAYSHLLQAQSTPGSKTKTTTAKAEVKTPLLTCNAFFPITHKMSRNYLMTTGKSERKLSSAYRVTHHYYQAKPRVIQGVPTMGIIREEFLEGLKVESDDKFAILDQLLSSAGFKKESRFYYACVDEPAPGLYELSEIMKQTSEVVGSYTQVTETYNRGSIVPKNITYEEIPEIEYDRVGTGKYNFRPITGSWFESDPEGFLETQWEKRLPMQAMGEFYSYEHHKFSILEMLPSMEVLGKTYESVMHTVDSIFEKQKDAETYGGLVCLRHNYYAKGIGLIKSVTIDEYEMSPEDPTRVISDIFNAGERRKTYTIQQLLPSPEADAQQLLLKYFSLKF